MLTDAEGEPTATFTYDAYGSLKASTGSQSTPLGYAAQYTLPQSGLQYLRARFYDPATAQFMTRDPLEALTREPYAYAFDNPMDHVDRTGLEAGELERPCVWPACPPPPPVVESLEEGVHAAEDLLEDAIQFITGEESDEEVESYYDENEGDHCPDRNWRQDKKVTERELEEAGLDAHDLKEGRKGTDIYKDRQGNLYEKPQGGRGPGEPLGVNINDYL